jgi:CRISPR-associated protein Cas2
MLILVTYDVSTIEKAGQQRLRRVAKVCQNFGQRVQFSVFECQVNEMQYEEILSTLRGIIDEAEDSLRIYRLNEPLEKNRREIGKKRAVDFEGVLLV